MVFVAVLLAALLHAGWNSLVKSGLDKRVSMGAVVLGHAPFALPLIVFSPLPQLESLPYLGAGILLHFGYQLFLMQSYRLGDLTQVYPLARGSAPLIVALFSAFVLGVPMLKLEALAVLIIAAGIISLALVRRTDGQSNPNAAWLALVTGGFIAAYSLVDGLGARLAGTALGFYAWLSLGNVVLMLAYLWHAPGGALRQIAGPAWRIGLFGGGASFAAYALVIWSFTQAPIALVTALRETSIVFALLIGVFVMKEPLDLRKLLATMTTLLGAALLRFAR
ncbi:putative transporter, permease protein [Roseobacter sp. SK209-2-6]|nr:putative transporter, permease protein [Roseobacter sp. SK209-2-6]